ncbi:hypothetical protein L3Q82_024286 [Scortum barcoo]|uniref:Uncharacterized protein n=1 Tax=Scortum barcoo TaxID=214431 RepID=A0ACB8WUM9_9TELE|nr:hypothetical protein L3Q82_024286 [Scortum barcoo]
MKTLCFTLGLLLLTACCCNTMPIAVQVSNASGNCCGRLYQGMIPLKFVTSITKTHSSCQQQAFIVQTEKGRKICYRQTFKWALHVYKQLHNRNSQRHKVIL